MNQKQLWNLYVSASNRLEGAECFQPNNKHYILQLTLEKKAISYLMDNKKARFRLTSENFHSKIEQIKNSLLSGNTIKEE